MPKFTIFVGTTSQLLEALEFFGAIQNFKVSDDGCIEISLARPHEIRARLWEAYAKQHKLTQRPDTQTFIPPGPPKEPPQELSLVPVLDGNILAVQTTLQELAATLTQGQVRSLITAETEGRGRVTLIRWLEAVAKSDVLRYR